jgi:hypothetical protein
MTGMSLEVTRLARCAVVKQNNYATIDLKGNVKCRGIHFKTTLEPETGLSHTIIGQAIGAAVLKGMVPEVTIDRCPDLVRFCSIVKSSGKSDVFLIEGGDEVPVEDTKEVEAKDGTKEIKTVHKVTVEGGEETPMGKVTRFYRSTRPGQRLVYRQAKGDRVVNGGSRVALANNLDTKLHKDIDDSSYCKVAR